MEGQAATMPSLDALILVEDQRTRPNQAHLAAQHVEQLGQLVQGGLSQEVADARYPGILGDLEEALLGFVAIDQGVLELLGFGDHRAELEQPEATLVAPDPHLAEEDGTFGVELD